MTIHMESQYGQIPTKIKKGLGRRLHLLLPSSKGFCYCVTKFTQAFFCRHFLLQFILNSAMYLHHHYQVRNQHRHSHCC